MALEVEPVAPPREQSEGAAPPSRSLLTYWSLPAFLAVEVLLFTVVTVFDSLGHGISVAIGAIYPCALITFLALMRTESPLGVAARRLAKKRIAIAAIAFISLFYLAGILAPVLPIHSYTDQNLEQALNGPSLVPSLRDRPPGPRLAEPLHLGVPDYGDRYILDPGLRAGCSFAIGLGLLSGYVGGWVDTAIMRIGDLFAGLPTLLMLISDQRDSEGPDPLSGPGVRTSHGYRRIFGIRIPGLLPDLRRAIPFQLGRRRQDHPIAGAGAARDRVHPGGACRRRLHPAHPLSPPAAERQQHHHRQHVAGPGGYRRLRDRPDLLRRRHSAAAPQLRRPDLRRQRYPPAERVPVASGFPGAA